MSYGTLHCHKGGVYLLEATSFTDYENGHKRDEHLSVSRKIDNNDNWHPIGDCLLSDLLWSDRRKEDMEKMERLGGDHHDAVFNLLIGYMGIGDTL